jgi:hypothetical protein
MRRSLIALSALLLSLPLAAAEEGQATSNEVGKQTREALELQRSGRAASETERPMSGEVAERTHRRYVESFSHPIPESFKDEEQEFVKGSN